MDFNPRITIQKSGLSNRTYFLDDIFKKFVSNLSRFFDFPLTQMKKTSIFLTFLFVLLGFQSTWAQAMANLEEDKPYIENGIEYSYSITNARDEKDYSRYEISIFARNKSGCQLIYLNRGEVAQAFDGDPAAVARFECVNATGRRLTSKGANLRARPFSVPYSQPTKGADGKTTFTNIRVPAGFLLRNGETLTSSLIVITALGEKPTFKVRIQNFSELTQD